MNTDQHKRPEWDTFITIMQKEIVPALGCTEPIAIALAAARAARELGAAPERVEVALSGNLLKNGMGVGVPGTGETGLDIAAAAGAIGGNDSLGLEVLRDLTPAQAEAAKRMVAEKLVCINLADTPDLLHAEVIVRSGTHYARAVLKHEHTNIVLVEKDGAVVFSTDDDAAEQSRRAAWPLSMEKVHEFASQAPFELISFILDAAKMNAAVAEEGLRHKYGLQVGKVIEDNIGKHLLSDDFSTYAMKLTAAASDARMDGVSMPVMSNSGSGNQGITCTMPVVAFARKLGSTEEQLARALIMSHLGSIHIKHHLGRLSALCGATVAATGASCGIVMLLGGGLPQISNAVKNMVGNVAGMICDGAKTSCALKVASSVSAAIQAAFMGMGEIAVSGKDGIVAADLEKSIQNLGRLASEGMAGTDKVILDIMVTKCQ
ncbi:L-serine ammonia-lyase, iron-sulfur-dependent, subunit alpha [Desulfovibrio sp. OttesenSCG-928-C06]|nr:L-serine ammonia-lyase, iron-sulfur-dependent, subunit alpha [Desulfovibrio sp. OttesenSCG-928-C06]